MYKAIVLDEKSREWLIEKAKGDHSREIVCHHLTICMGTDSKSKFPFEVGETVEMKMDKIGVCIVEMLPEKQRAKVGESVSEDTILATCVSVVLPEGKFVKNKTPHITLSVNRKAGGKPVHSNYATLWCDISEGEIPVLRGTVQLCD